MSAKPMFEVPEDFRSAVPIYEPELLLHQSRGAAALEQAFHEAAVDIDWIRPGRPSVSK